MNSIKRADPTTTRCARGQALQLHTPEYTLARGGIAGIDTTANIIYGITKNPYDLSRSSGGAGAIVAAGGAAFDVGSDWGAAFAGHPTITALRGSGPPPDAFRVLDTLSISVGSTIPGNSSVRSRAASKTLV